LRNLISRLNDHTRLGTLMQHPRVADLPQTFAIALRQKARRLCGREFGGDAPAIWTASSSGSSSQRRQHASMPEPRGQDLWRECMSTALKLPAKNPGVFESHCAAGLCGGETGGFKELGAAAGGVEAAVGCGGAAPIFVGAPTSAGSKSRNALR
jgi:hypothetical protein